MTAGKPNTQTSTPRSAAEPEAEVGTDIDVFPIGLFVCTLEGRLTTINRAAALLLGYAEPTHLAGANLFDVFAFHPASSQAATIVSAAGPVLHFELDYVRPDQQTMHIHVHLCARPAVAEPARPLVWAGALYGAKDVLDLPLCYPQPLDLFSRLFSPAPTAGESEQQLRQTAYELQHILRQRQRLQAQLIHNEKMAALGRLTASIAHEINNPIQAIQGCLSLVHEEYEGESRRDRIERYLNVVYSEIDRIAVIISNLRNFYRSDAFHETVASIDLQPVLDNVLKLVEKQCQQRGITLDIIQEDELPLIPARPQNLKQVFLNLLLNAIDAMPNGGSIILHLLLDTLMRIEPGDGVSTSYHQAVRIDFIDTGVGIPARVLEHIFEPFFTTKEYGSGLGLSITYGIVEAHHGQIKVQSVEGRGTTVTLLLPLTWDITD